MFGHGHVMQWAKKKGKNSVCYAMGKEKRKEKYMLCNGQGKKTKKISRDRCTDDAKRAVFARGCQFYESMCIIIVRTDSRNFDNNTQARLHWNPPPKWELPFTFRILHLIHIHLCDFVSGEEVWRGGGERRRMRCCIQQHLLPGPLGHMELGQVHS